MSDCFCLLTLCPWKEKNSKLFEGADYTIVKLMEDPVKFFFLLVPRHMPF